MVTIVGYGYDAALHCPPCTRDALKNGIIAPAAREPRDEHRLPEAMKDSVGNAVHPLFSTDEPSDTGEHCICCKEDLRA